MEPRVNDQDTHDAQAHQPQDDALATPEHGRAPVAGPASVPAWQRLNWRAIVPWALAALLVVVAIGAAVHALAARRSTSAPPVDALATAIARATPRPTATSTGLTTAAVPSATIRFDVWRTTFSQQCDGTQALPAITTTLDNTRSTIAVDWWLDIEDKTPDGKTLWAAADMPYGTTPMKYIQDVSIMPDSALCAALQGKTSPITYHVMVNYAGLGEITITDTISPPTSSGTPTP
jgi:hypothetical protein